MSALVKKAIGILETLDENAASKEIVEDILDACLSDLIEEIRGEYTVIDVKVRVGADDRRWEDMSYCVYRFETTAEFRAFLSSCEMLVKLRNIKQFRWNYHTGQNPSGLQGHYI